MKKLLMIGIAILPLLASAQPGGEFGGMSPPPGGPVGGPHGKPPKTMEHMKPEAMEAIEKARQGADIIYQGAEAFLAFADQVYSLPTASYYWAQIEPKLDNTNGDENTEENQNIYQKYNTFLLELSTKVDVLDSLWNEEIVPGFAQYSDSLLAIESEMDTGLKYSKQALNVLNESIARQEEILEMMTSDEDSIVPPDGSSLKEMIYDSAGRIKELKTLAERSREEIRIGEIIVSRISDITQQSL